MKHFIITLLILFSSIFSFGQYISWGSDPASIKWQQINTEQFQIIYPEGYDSVANVFAAKLNYVYSEVSASLNHTPKKISVLLHNQSTISNAFVAWAPARMEIFDVPSQTKIAQDWFNLLAVHEYRHVVQTDKMNQGLTRILYFLMGEQAVGLVLGAYIPLWYLEGDAVCIETALSNAGRGRQASFSMGLRAQLYEKKIFSYDKAYFGSYREFVPNHYVMGYYYVSGVRKKYSQDVWNNTLNRVAQKPFSLTPFNKGLKKETSLSKLKLYKETFELQKTLWQLDYEREGHSPFDTLTKLNKKIHTSYVFARRYNDGSIITEKTSLNDIPYIVQIDKQGFETKITRVGFKNYDEAFSSNNVMLTWAETNADIRWELASTTNIYMYTFATKKITKINTKKRVFSPAISPMSDKIIGITIDSKGRNYLILYSVNSKQEIGKIAMPYNEFPQGLSWNDNGETVVMTTISGKGKRIVEVNINTKEFTEIHPYTNDDVSNPCYWKEYVLYSSSYSGVDNIYAINKSTKEIFRLTSSSFGCKFPSVKDDRLMFSDYTSSGYQIGEKDLFPRSWHSIDVIKKAKYDLAETLAYQEGGAIDFSKMSDTIFESKPYRRIPHLFSIHSWMPAYVEYNSGINSQGLGVQLLSQNKLSTMESAAGFRTSNGGKQMAAFGKFTYTGLFPVINFEASKGYTEQSTVSPTNDTVTANFNTKDVFGYIQLPFNLSSRSYQRLLAITAKAQFASYTKYNETSALAFPIYKDYTSYFSLGYNFTFINQRNKAHRDLAPKWGQTILLGIETTPDYYETKANDFTYAQTSFYFPGFAKNHSLSINADYQNNKIVSTGNYTNMIDGPRGYIDVIEGKKQMYTLRGTYMLPLFYPDFSAGPILYLKRISANLFADYTAVIADNNFVLPGDSSFETTNKAYKSYGYEMIFNVHILRLLPEFSMGYRHAFMPLDGTQSMSFIFDMQF